MSAVAAIHKSIIGTSCLYRLQIKTKQKKKKKKKKQTLSYIVIFLTKPVVFFRSVELTFFVNSIISRGMSSLNIIDASDFATRTVSFNQTKAECPL